MPADYRIDTAKRRVFSEATGHLTYDDLKGHMNRLSRDPKFDPAFFQIIDFRGVTTFDLRAEDVITLAAVRVFSPQSKRAFVAPEAVKFGLARMYESYRAPKGDRAIRVFQDYDEAAAWLDLEEPADPAGDDRSRAAGIPGPGA
jgi:hypothetical protein